MMPSKSVIGPHTVPRVQNVLAVANPCAGDSNDIDSPADSPIALKTASATAAEASENRVTMQPMPGFFDSLEAADTGARKLAMQAREPDAGGLFEALQGAIAQFDSEYPAPPTEPKSESGRLQKAYEELRLRYDELYTNHEALSGEYEALYGQTEMLKMVPRFWGVRVTFRLRPYNKPK